MSSEQPSGISDVLRAWEAKAEEETSNVGTILDAAGSRTAGPFLFLAALIMISPIGAIPGVPIVLSTVIILVAVQVVFGTTSIWLPSFLKERSIPQDKVETVVDTLTPYAQKADRYLGQRLSALTGRTMSRVVAALCILLALLVYPATLIPFAAAAPGGAILLLSLGLLARDGILMLAGLIATAAAVFAILWFLVL